MTIKYPNAQSNPAGAIPVWLATGMGVALGYQQITDLSAAAVLTVPAGATQATILAENAPVRWRNDGVAPTAAVGMLLPPGVPMQIGGSLTAYKFIQTAPGGALNVNYS